VRRLAILIVAAAALAGCGGGDGGETGDSRSTGMKVRAVATGLEIPWEMAFLPDGRALVTERPGRIRLLDAGLRLQAAPVAQVPVSAQGEGGLMGLALDPEFESNGFVYLYFTTAEGMRLERWRFEAGRMARDATLVTDIRAGSVHDSGRIAFGPDDGLYVATGDAGDSALAQDDGSLNGKFLRLTPEQYRGTAVVRPEIYSKGNRNPQGLDWEPGTDRLIATEHGPSGFDGPQGLDEVNHIRRGGNYQWPKYGEDQKGDAAPLRLYQDAIAPSGATFVTAEGSQWTGDYLIATLRGEALRRLRIDGDRVTEDEALLEGRFGRLRTVVEGPGGKLYVLTSNRDGRGDPAADDDRILEITPPR
jgi:glucose/arabinose dehydrogenase